MMQLREFAMNLQVLVEKDCHAEELHTAKIKMMTEVRQMSSICDKVLNLG